MKVKLCAIDMIGPEPGFFHAYADQGLYQIPEVALVLDGIRYIGKVDEVIVNGELTRNFTIHHITEEQKQWLQAVYPVLLQVSDEKYSIELISESRT